MSNIATHFEMLMDPEEQERIGVTPERDEHMRVMRTLSAYQELREVIKEQQTRIGKLEAENISLTSQRDRAIKYFIEFGMYVDEFGRKFKAFKEGVIPTPWKTHEPRVVGFAREFEELAAAINVGEGQLVTEENVKEFKQMLIEEKA